MLGFFKTLFKDLSKDFIKEWIEVNYMQYGSLTFITIGGSMITQHIIGWLLVSLGFIMGIYWIRTFLTNLHKNAIDQIFNTTDKLILHDEVLINCFFTNEGQLFIFLTYTLYNYSFNLIHVSFNPKTQYKIRIPANNDQTTYENTDPIYPKLPPVLPFYPNRQIQTYAIKIPFKDEMIIEIRGVLCLNYTHNNKDFQQVEKSIISLHKLIKTKNEKNETIIIAQPA